MKRKILAVLSIAVLAVIFIGFGFTKNIEMEKEYQRAMDRGIEAVKETDYRAAKIDFQDALKRKQNDQRAKQALKQVNTYMDAKKQLSQKHYQEASALFKQVAVQDDGINVLIRRASSYHTELEDVVQEQEAFNKLYKQAADLSDAGNYFASNQKLSAILEYQQIDRSYYDTIRTKAEHLKESNDEYLRIYGHKPKM